MSRRMILAGYRPLLLAKVIDATPLQKKVHLVWRLLDEPFQGHEIDDFVYCMGENAAAEYKREKLYRLGLFFGHWKEGEAFAPKRLIGLKTRILLEPSHNLSTTPHVIYRRGEDEEDYNFIKWLKANSYNPLLRNSSFNPVTENAHADL